MSTILTQNNETATEMLWITESESTISQSNIYYMGLVDKNADLDDTMMLITEKIFDEMKTQHQNGHLILVGDGKTYAHLRKTTPLRLGVRKATHHIPRDYLVSMTAAKEPKHGSHGIPPAVSGSYV